MLRRILGVLEMEELFKRSTFGVSNVMSQQEQDEFYMNFALRASLLATCPRLHVGAIIVSEAGFIIGSGHNTTPDGIPTCEEAGCKKNDQGRCIATVHAEQKALLSIQHKSDLKNSKIYVTHYPCENCSKLLLEAGIQEVIYEEYYDNELSRYFLDTINVRQLKG